MGYLNLTPQPRPRTLTNRLDLAGRARRRMGDYMEEAENHRWSTDGGRNRRVMMLLWAEAFIQQALALETWGALGDQHATPHRIVEAYRLQDAS